MAKNKIIHHTTFKPGMTSDYCKQCAKTIGCGSRSGKPRWTKVIGENDFGIIVKWYYNDCTLVFSKNGKQKPYTLDRVEVAQDPRKSTLHEGMKGVRVPPGSAEYKTVIAGLAEEVKRADQA